MPYTRMPLEVLQRCETPLKRVIISPEGYAATPQQAMSKHGIVEIDAILVRSDGWSLGTTAELAHVARSVWQGHWEFFVTTEGVLPMALWDVFFPAP